MHTTSPSASAAATASKARALACGSSLAGAMGIARAVRNTKFSSGTLKMWWSITKRTGRNQRVHEADVVADQHARAFFRDVLQPFVADAVQRVGGDPHQEAHHEF